MNLGFWQLAVVSVLLVAWVVVLVGPTVLRGIRWILDWPERRQIRREELDWFGEKPSMFRSLSHSAAELFYSRPRPVQQWRSQPIERRRLQVLLGLVIVGAFSMFCAFVFRGLFVWIFASMVALNVLALVVATVVGSRELRKNAAETVDQKPRQVGSSQSARTTVRSARPSSGGPLDSLLYEIETAQSGSVEPSGPDTSIIDRESLNLSMEEPDLQFEPLNLDAVLSEFDIEASVAEVLDEMPSGNPLAEQTQIDQDSIDVDDSTVSQSTAVPDADDGPRVVGPGFAAAPEAGSRQASARARFSKRRKATPIHIESTLDDDGFNKVVNDS